MGEEIVLVREYHPTCHPILGGLSCCNTLDDDCVPHLVIFPPIRPSGVTLGMMGPHEAATAEAKLTQSCAPPDQGGSVSPDMGTELRAARVRALGDVTPGAVAVAALTVLLLLLLLLENIHDPLKPLPLALLPLADRIDPPWWGDRGWPFSART